MDEITGFLWCVVFEIMKSTTVWSWKIIVSFGVWMFNDVLKGEQVDLFAFPPICLPSQGQTFSGSDGVVAGELFVIDKHPKYMIRSVNLSQGGDLRLQKHISILMFFKRQRWLFPGCFISYLPIIGPNHRKGRLQGEYGGKWTQLHWGSPLCWWKRKRNMSGTIG